MEMEVKEGENVRPRGDISDPEKVHPIPEHRRGRGQGRETEGDDRREILQREKRG